MHFLISFDDELKKGNFGAIFMKITGGQLLYPIVAHLQWQNVQIFTELPLLSLT